MKVRAIKRGFFGGIYRTPGDEFDCPPDAFSKSWMQSVKEGFNVPIPKQEGIPPLEIPSLINKDRSKQRKTRLSKKTI